MLSSKVSIVTLTLLSIYTTHAQNISTFTEERRIEQRLIPIKLNDKTLFSYWRDNSTIITSFEPGYEECEIPSIIPGNRWTLGNGKIVAMTLIVTHFTIFDFKNCSSYSSISVDNGESYKYDFDKAIGLVVPYNDTFDVFDEHRRTCKPCRYNDKGERLQMEHKLMPESKYHDDYFVEPVENAFGIEKGYLYSFSFQNYTTIMKVLDLDYNVVKERIINGSIVGHSLLHKTSTICYVEKSSSFTECQTLDSDLNTITTFKMHQPFETPLITTFEVINLPTGGAMVGMEYLYWDLSSDNTCDIFIQQIHANGLVEPAISFGTFKSNYVGVYDFISKNGEYCLVAEVDNKKNGDYSLMRCVIPKIPKND